MTGTRQDRRIIIITTTTTSTTTTTTKRIIGFVGSKAIKAWSRAGTLVGRMVGSTTMIMVGYSGVVLGQGEREGGGGES